MESNQSDLCMEKARQAVEKKKKKKDLKVLSSARSASPTLFSAVAEVTLSSLNMSSDFWRKIIMKALDISHWPSGNTVVRNGTGTVVFKSLGSLIEGDIASIIETSK